MKTLNLIFIFSLATSAVYAQPIDRLTFYECKGSAAKTLPEKLRLSLSHKRALISQMRIQAVRYKMGDTADTWAYVAPSGVGVENAVLTWKAKRTLTGIDQTQGTLDLSVPTQMGRLHKTYECTAFMAEG